MAGEVHDASWITRDCLRSDLPRYASYRPLRCAVVAEGHHGLRVSTKGDRIAHHAIAPLRLSANGTGEVHVARRVTINTAHVALCHIAGDVATGRCTFNTPLESACTVNLREEYIIRPVGPIELQGAEGSGTEDPAADEGIAVGINCHIGVVESASAADLRPMPAAIGAHAQDEEAVGIVNRYGLATECERAFIEAGATGYVQVVPWIEAEPAERTCAVDGDLLIVLAQRIHGDQTQRLELFQTIPQGSVRIELQSRYALTIRMRRADVARPL